MVVDSGYDVSHIVPIYEGSTVPRAIKRLDFGGHHLTKLMVKDLHTRGYTFKTAAEVELVRDIKKTMTYVAMDYDEELKKGTSVTTKDYELPEGSVITLDVARFKCPEALFQPSMMNEKSDGIPKATLNAIMSCDCDIRKDVFANILLAGGSTMFPGFEKRLMKEITALVPPNIARHDETINIIALPGSESKFQDWSQRRYSAWYGGSILADHDSFQSYWITKAEYEDTGPSIVHRKCL